MMISAASDDTTLPTAPPTIPATANASTLFFSRNSLNPRIIVTPGQPQYHCEGLIIAQSVIIAQGQSAPNGTRLFLLGPGQEAGQALHGGLQNRLFRGITNAD